MMRAPYRYVVDVRAEPGCSEQGCILLIGGLRRAGSCALGPPWGYPITGAMLVIPRFLPGSHPAQSLLNVVKASPFPHDLEWVLTC
jgi:hypothetical protein